MSTVWFTSDLHLGHRLVAKHRGFTLPGGDGDTASHDRAVIDGWKRAVADNDQVWVLGDLSMTGTMHGVETLLSKLDGLPGRKHLVPGNHDPVHSMHRGAHKWQVSYNEVFESVQAFARIRINKVNILLSHFPYAADRGEARYMQYRLPDHGEWLLHGHTHSAEKVTGPQEIHVGLDAWGLAPVNISEIERLMREAGAFEQ